MRTVLAVLGLGLVVSCVPRVATGCDLDTPYHAAVRQWTAKANIYQFADQRAQFQATIESKVFRQQRARELAHEQGWSREAEQTELEKQRKADLDETSFILGAYTEIPHDNSLGEARSIWRVALDTPTGEVLPTRIDPIGRPDSNSLALYPYLDNFQRAYRLHFPKVVQGPVTLKIGSAAGLAKLEFEQL